MTGVVFRQFMDTRGKVCGMEMAEFRNLLQRLFKILEGQASAEMGVGQAGPSQAEGGGEVSSREVNFIQELLAPGLFDTERRIVPLDIDERFSQHFGEWAVRQMQKQGWQVGEPLGQDYGHSRLSTPLGVTSEGSGRRTSRGLGYTQPSSSSTTWVRSGEETSGGEGGMTPVPESGSEGVAVPAPSPPLPPNLPAPPLTTAPERPTPPVTGVATGCFEGGAPGCPPGYMWPPSEVALLNPPRVNASSTTCYGHRGIRFLKEIGFWCSADAQREVSEAYINVFVHALGVRHVLAETFADPEAGTWYRYHFPECGICPERCLDPAVDAWHGTSIFGVASIIKEGRMRPGQAEPSGIYCHKQGTKSKAQSYMYHTPIGGGVLIAPLVHLRIRNHQRVRVDQWLVQPQDCSIDSILFRVVTIGGLASGREWLTVGWGSPSP